MDWVGTIMALLKFVVTELPAFLEQLRIVSKDTKYKTNKARFAAARNKYKETLALEDLNEITE